VAKQVRESRAELTKSSSLENKIRLTTWLLMYAELAMEKDRLWTRAIDAFNEGLEQLSRSKPS